MTSTSTEIAQEILIEEVTPVQVLGWLESNEIVLVDVRETSEYQQEHISGAVLYPLSMFDADIFPKFSDKRVVLHCAVGKRSAAAAKQLLKTGYNNVLNMAGGLANWKQSGCPTEIQQQGAAGSAVLPMLVINNDEPESAPASAEGEDVHPGQILKIEFMEPLEISDAKLANALSVPEPIITKIVDGKSHINAELALRLARYLCTTDEFWLRLQLAYDLADARKTWKTTIRREVQPRRGSSVSSPVS